MANRTRPNRLLRRSLTQKIAILSAEAAACTCAASFKCVSESIADAQRQLKAELDGAK
jgi:hypothetical protein